MTRFSREYGEKLAKAQDDRRRSAAALKQAAESIPDRIRVNGSGKAAPPKTFRLAAEVSKYKNVAQEGYASKREAKRAADLTLLLRGGKIRNLREQVPFLLIPKQEGERACSYVADFVYTENGAEIVEDCKGMRTSTYRIKRKLMLFVHGIRIRET